MANRGIVRGKSVLRCLLIPSFLLFLVPMAQGQNEVVLYNFTNSQGSTDGWHPQGRLVMDANGNLYGATLNGGANGVGTVFEVTPAGAETVLHSFANNGTDGFSPNGGLVRDSQGNLYGLTFQGPYGSSTEGLACGTLFKVTASGTETLLYSFGSNGQYDGCAPLAGLISDSEGNLYGTTSNGGTSGRCGTVFKVTPSGVETVLYNFANNSTDGCIPESDLVFDNQGNLYGTTVEGGTSGYGTVFKVTSSGNETVLHSFGAPTDTKDGSSPMNSDLAIDNKGNLYGTTSGGGAFEWGTVFKITPTGKETVLHSFSLDGFTCTGGYSPYLGVVSDAAGNLYGTTSVGASYGSGGLSNDGGQVFELPPSELETDLHDFPYYFSPDDGSFPSGNLIMDSKGNLYGVTGSGGTTNGGTVYEIYRAGSAATSVKLTTSESPSYYYDFVTLTATVSSATGPVPDGELITFDDGGTVLIAAPLAGGVASYSTYMGSGGIEYFDPLPLGSHVITALYGGDATFKASQGTVTQVVDKYTTVTILSTSANPSNYGEPVTMTAQVTNGGYATGTVTFYNGSVKLGAAKLNSEYAATLKTAALPLGSDTLTATYGGDSYNLASTSSPVTQVVNQAKIRMSLTSSPNPSTGGESVTFTATLTSTGGLPNGSQVTFSYNGTALGAGTILGREATFSTGTLPVGTDVVQATYAGNADYSSASATITQTVN